MTLTNHFDETGLINCSIVPPANVSSSVLLLISHLGVTFTTFTLTITSLIHILLSTIDGDMMMMISERSVKNCLGNVLQLSWFMLSL